MLTRHQSQPSSQLAAILEVPPITNRCHGRVRCERTDADQSTQTHTAFITVGAGLDLLIASLQSFPNFLLMRAQHIDQFEQPFG